MQCGGEHPHAFIPLPCFKANRGSTVTENNGHVPPGGGEIQAGGVYFGTHEQNPIGHVAANVGVGRCQTVQEAGALLAYIKGRCSFQAQFGLEQGVDFIALSFVRTAHDVKTVKRRIAKAKQDTPLIAKIEKFEALDNIDEIIAEADGIMVARGDLGVEIPLESVPRAQKMLIRKTNEAAKPVITATQMLRSMVENPRPTRAEVTDVANAIYDGTDAIMLSEETAMGAYPIEAVQVMSSVAADTESNFDYDGWKYRFPEDRKLSFKRAVAHSAVAMAKDIDAAAIITCTKSGGTTKLVARYRPRQALLTMTPVWQTALRMALTFGAIPVVIDMSESAEGLEKLAISEALQAGFVKPGQPVVITAGLPFNVEGTTNLIKVATAEWS